MWAVAAARPRLAHLDFQILLHPLSSCDGSVGGKSTPGSPQGLLSLCMTRSVTLQTLCPVLS